MNNSLPSGPGSSSSKDHNQREHPRVSVDNLISVVSLDNGGNQISHSMGRVLNVSQSGVLIELAHPVKTINGSGVSLVTVDKKDRVVYTNGRIVHSCRVTKGQYATGIRFGANKHANRHFVVSLVKKYYFDKHYGMLDTAA